MAQIEQRVGRGGEVHWRARVRVKGGAPQCETFARKTDAVLWAQQREADIRAGRAFHGSEARRKTLADLAGRYRAEVLPQYSAREQGWRGQKLAWWETRLGHLRLAEVAPSTITASKDSLAKQGGLSTRPLSPATQVRYLAVLSHLFSYAVRDLGWLETNPVAKVRRPREPRGRVRFLSEDERARLLAACRSSRDPQLYALVVLALGTGGRQGELLGLRWRDIDLRRGVAVLHQTKNNERRSLVLAGAVLKVVRELGSVRRIDGDHIFGRHEGAPAFPRKAWEQAVKAADLEDFHFHDLRHTFASYLAMNGATLAELADALGHKTLAMVKRYAHLTEQHTSGVVTRMVERVLR
ncbi:MAG TPA: site-specific integrase [Thermoanaerobaculia bacterium]|jgi:integrase|nr:site-specific integrase [Thermoanaerobaculia bacterium]